MPGAIEKLVTNRREDECIVSLSNFLGDSRLPPQSLDNKVDPNLYCVIITILLFVIRFARAV